MKAEPTLDSDFVGAALGLSGGLSGKAPKVFNNVTSDSRKVAPGDLFVALQGDRFDGHDFVEQAIAQGAAGLICRQGTAPADDRALAFEVEDTLDAYRALAGAWRRQFDLPVIAVAGSVGKTTTKELLAAILRGRFEHLLKTEASQNGYIGIAMTLLNLRSRHQVAVVEIGIDEPGAMAKHVELVAPDVSVVTAIGPEHLERLIDLDTVAREENLILRRTYLSGGTVAVNMDDPLIAPVAAELKGSAGKVVCFSAQASEFTSEFINPLPGRHNAGNLAAAIACARAIGLSDAEISKGLATFKTAPGRSELAWLTGDTPVIRDYYNANPTSVAAGLELLRTLSEGRRPRWACLADMLELGSNEERFHRELADSLDGVEHVLLFGERMRWLAHELKSRSFPGEVTHFETKEALSKHIGSGLKPGHAILIKGSRGMRMEDVWNELERQASQWTKP